LEFRKLAKRLIEKSNPMKNIITKSLPIVVLFMTSALPIFAQKSDPNVPIDGGLSILLAAGAAYGAKKVYDKRKEN